MTVKEKIQFLVRKINPFLVVHYSRQNLNDNIEGFSPRITSIAVLQVGSSTTHSFYIHLIAEIRKILKYIRQARLMMLGTGAISFAFPIVYISAQRLNTKACHAWPAISNGHTQVPVKNKYMSKNLSALKPSFIGIKTVKTTKISPVISVHYNSGLGCGGVGRFIYPSIGHEIMVDFIDDDPDRPIITDMLYNGKNKSPMDSKIKKAWRAGSSKGGSSENCIGLIFDDKVGQ